MVVSLLHPFMQIECPTCNAIVHWNVDRCPRCRADVGAPNVRLVDIDQEKLALMARYENAIATAETRGAKDVVREFEDAVNKSSQAVINVNADFLWTFLRDKRALYVGYEILADAEIRKPASFEDDRRRRGVDAIVHGALAKSITCAALSLDGNGLHSYGIAGLTISDTTVAASGTCLERNSYDFVSKHRLVPGDPLPAGFRSVWQRRGLLAVAKLADEFQPDTNVLQFARLLLVSDRHRKRDEFIEVHLFGPFDWQAITAIAIQGRPKPGSMERQMLDNCHDLADQGGIVWTER